MPSRPGRIQTTIGSELFLATREAISAPVRLKMWSLAFKKYSLRYWGGDVVTLIERYTGMWPVNQFSLKILAHVPGFKIINLNIGLYRVAQKECNNFKNIVDETDFFYFFFFFIEHSFSNKITP